VRAVEAQRDTDALLAAQRERARIAQELHDVVTHNVSVMVVQAGAARAVLAVAPEKARQALLAIESGGRAAMSELRHVMGLLSMDGGPPDRTWPDELTPPPGLAQVPTLVARVRDAGVPVDLTVTGTLGPLPGGVNLAAYRVVQEALTNAMNHAVGAHLSVRIDHGSDALRGRCPTPAARHRHRPVPVTAGACAACANASPSTAARLTPVRSRSAGTTCARRSPWSRTWRHDRALARGPVSASGRHPAERGGGVTERSEVIIRLSPPGQGGSPRSGDPA
jgi:hypothetical protein